MNIKDVKQMGVRISSTPKRNAPPIDAGTIRELAELLTETGLTEIEIEQAGQRLRVVRQPGTTSPQVVSTAPVAVPPSPAIQPASSKHDAYGAGTVASPMVGTVYVAPEPGKPPFVKVGDRVKEGDTLLIVEAMKTMNPILSPRSGIVSEICIHDAQPVEFGQALLVIN